MKIIERLYLYFEFKGIKPTSFEKELGISNGYFNTMLKRKADMGESILLKIIEYSLDLNPMWLILGEGDMIKQSATETPVPSSPNFESKCKDHYTSQLESENKRLIVENERKQELIDQFLKGNIGWKGKNP